MTRFGLAFGITAGSRPDHRRLGEELERMRYPELWVNDTRRADGVATLAEIAPGTRRLAMGIGVVALSEHAPERIAERVGRAGLPKDRITVGVGSGSSASLALVRDGVRELRRVLPDVPIGVAAVGPRMAELAGEIADVVVANWALPPRLAETRMRVAAGAGAARRPAPPLVAYVRTAIGVGAGERLAAEQRRYRRFGRHYERAFATQPGDVVGVAVESADAAEVRAALAPYRAVVETVVVRGLPSSDEVEAWLEIARAAADPPG